MTEVTQNGHRATLEKMLEDRRKWLTNNERMIELMAPEMERFESKEAHNIYATRLAVDHAHYAKRDRKEIGALEWALNHTRPASTEPVDALAEARDAVIAAALNVIESKERPGSRVEYSIGPDGEEVWYDYHEVSDEALGNLCAALSRLNGQGEVK